MAPPPPSAPRPSFARSAPYSAVDHEATIAPQGPAAGVDGRRPDWAVLGDVGKEKTLNLLLFIFFQFFPIPPKKYLHATSRLQVADDQRRQDGASHTKRC